MIHYGTYINERSLRYTSGAVGGHDKSRPYSLLGSRGVPHKTGKNLDMIVCAHCGKEIAEQRTTCPSCGTSLLKEQTSPGMEAVIGSIAPGEKGAKPFPFDSLYEEYIPQLAPIYERNYAARSAHPVNTTSQKAPAAEQEKVSSTTPIDNPPDTFAPLTFRERFFPTNTKRTLMLEIALSLLIGIFGVGWLLIGQKRTGTMLLVTSLIFYAPLLIVSYALAYFSYGLSILCTGPFVFGAVALNAFMLHKTVQWRIRVT